MFCARCGEPSVRDYDEALRGLVGTLSAQNHNANGKGLKEMVRQAAKEDHVCNFGVLSSSVSSVPLSIGNCAN
jgi:hypothetical protein